MPVLRHIVAAQPKHFFRIFTPNITNPSPFFFKQFFFMTDIGTKAKNATLESLGLQSVLHAHWNLTADELIQKSIDLNEGVIASNGALAINTGKFTGRSPKDRFVVEDENTAKTVWWGRVNIAFSPENFDKLHQKMAVHLSNKSVFVRDCYACADANYRLNVRVVTETAYANLFAYNMFLRPTNAEVLEMDMPDWSVVNAPSFEADPETDGTRQANFAIINFTKKIILIGGTAYTGEIKKGIFSVLNYVLPHERNTLSMHCSANEGKNGDTAVFFGLSGTGKTTLSADPNRALIGDDEHGWGESSVFNFEGGCYAKTIDLTSEKEPEIFAAIKHGAILENIGFEPGTNTPNYADNSLTENTRVSYPIHFIQNAKPVSVGGSPKNIFFLTCDAFGVLPPISKLSTGQAMYHFISGYTAKVAGTEVGVKEPQTTFSACFGAAFLPLHPTQYAELLGKKMRENNVNVWLINTGWSGGGYGVGKRMNLKYTRAMITAALDGLLDNETYHTHPIFGVAIPKNCPDVPAQILDPRLTWRNAHEYDQKATELAQAFNQNFEEYASQASPEILAAAPKMG